MNSKYLSSLEEFEQDASDNDECSTNKVILKVNDSFNDWISVQTVVDLYAKQNGFVANKIQKEVDSIDNSIIRRRVYTCWKSEKKLIQCDTEILWCHDETDAATMFLYLLKQCENDSEYVVIPRLEGPANELTGLFWMTSQQRNNL
ncbi:unnamed protein product [Rhizophagus irregularis]|nr:unnamed protein product [Rhizophagus irregularis]